MMCDRTGLTRACTRPPQKAWQRVMPEPLGVHIEKLLF